MTTSGRKRPLEEEGDDVLSPPLFPDDDELEEENDDVLFPPLFPETENASDLSDLDDLMYAQDNETLEANHLLHEEDDDQLCVPPFEEDDDPSLDVLAYLLASDQF